MLKEWCEEVLFFHLLFAFDAYTWCSWQGKWIIVSIQIITSLWSNWLGVCIFFLPCFTPIHWKFASSLVLVYFHIQRLTIWLQGSIKLFQIILYNSVFFNIENQFLIKSNYLKASIKQCVECLDLGIWITKKQRVNVDGRYNIYLVAARHNLTLF